MRLVGDTISKWLGKVGENDSIVLFLRLYSIVSDCILDLFYLDKEAEVDNVFLLLTVRRSSTFFENINNC